MLVDATSSRIKSRGRDLLHRCLPPIWLDAADLVLTLVTAFSDPCARFHGSNLVVFSLYSVMAGRRVLGLGIVGLTQSSVGSLDDGFGGEHTGVLAGNAKSSFKESFCVSIEVSDNAVGEALPRLPPLRSAAGLIVLLRHTTILRSGHSIVY